MTDYRRHPCDLPDCYDGPDICESTFAPHWARSIRHGAMSLAACLAVAVIVAGALGGVGWVVYLMVMATGIVG